VFAVLAVIGVMATSSLPTTQPVDLSSPALFPAVSTVLPDNLDGPGTVLALMREMWVRSPTFRRQCARLALAANGRITIEVRNQGSFVFRAATFIESQSDGKWRATVAVFLYSDLVELIAHELEHIIEQLDGIDLMRLQQQGVSGVTSGHQEHFETVRAATTGKRVAREFAHPPKPVETQAKRQES
jgi:hypothetical protein